MPDLNHAAKVPGLTSGAYPELAAPVAQPVVSNALAGQSAPAVELKDDAVVDEMKMNTGAVAEALLAAAQAGPGDPAQANGAMKRSEGGE